MTAEELSNHHAAVWMRESETDQYTQARSYLYCVRVFVGSLSERILSQQSRCAAALLSPCRW